MFGIFKEKCPHCGKSNINTVKESFGKSLTRNAANVVIPIRILFANNRKPKDLKVCKDCGFSWEPR